MITLMPGEDMAETTDEHRHAAARLWPDDADDQLAGAHALAAVPPEVGWRVVANSIDLLQDFGTRRPDLLLDATVALLALTAADQVRATVRSIVLDRIAS